jgi:protein-tyrosine kinase
MRINSNTAMPQVNAGDTLVDQSIGDIISKTKALSGEQVAKIVEYQKQTSLRFGEAAVALGFVTSDDVLFALAQQFHYPYSPVNRQALNPELVSAAQPFSKQAEAFRAIRGQLLVRAFAGEGPKSALAVISANTADGKTFFSANIAVVLSQLGGRTLLIDADMRGPRQHEVFGVPNTMGLSGLLSGRSGEHAICAIPDLPSLFLLPGGPVPPNPIELIERPAFSMLLRELVTKFDYVVVDTPAAFYGADASALAMKCGAALCLARQGNSRLSGIQDLIATMSAGSVQLAGVIMNEY